MVSDPKTLSAYDREAETYLSRSRDWPDEPWIDKVADRLSPGAKLLDLGCGPAGAAKCFADKGFAVTAVDGSPEMVRIAREQTGLDVKLMRFEDLDAVTAYDAIWSSFALHHVAKSALPGIVDRIATALTPDGVFMISVKTGDKEAYDRLDRFYAYYQPEELAGLLTSAGFAVLETEQGDGVGLDGTPSGLIWVLARKQ